MKCGEPRHTIAMSPAASCLDRGGVCAYVGHATAFAGDSSRIARALSWMTRAERDRLQKEVQELARKRDAYIRTENTRLAEAGKSDGFDEKVAETIHQQAKRKGISYAP